VVEWIIITFGSAFRNDPEGRGKKSWFYKLLSMVTQAKRIADELVIMATKQSTYSIFKL